MPLTPLSKSLNLLSKPMFQKKYIKLGRIYSHWPHIIGKEFYDKAMPVELKIRPVTKNKKEFSATLTILTDSAHAILLSYQKDVILGRAEHLFGERLITDIKIIQGTKLLPADRPQKQALSVQEQKDINALIQHVDDADLRQRLADFATSLYHSSAKKTKDQKT